MGIMNTIMALQNRGGNALQVRVIRVIEYL